MTDYNSQMLNVRTGLDFSFWKDMHLRYGLTFNQNRMRIQSMDYSLKTDGWKQDLSIVIPVSPFTIDLRGEYYRNDTYSYVITSDLTSSTSTNRIRGRELLLTAYYKL